MGLATTCTMSHADAAGPSALHPRDGRVRLVCDAMGATPDCSRVQSAGWRPERGCSSPVPLATTRIHIVKLS